MVETCFLGKKRKALRRTRHPPKFLHLLASDSIWSNVPSGSWQDVFARVNKALSAGQYVTVDAMKVRPMKGQPREYFPEEEQDSMKESLGLTGQIQDAIIRKLPPKDLSVPSLVISGGRTWTVEETEYEIVDGERRWRGLLEKGLPFRAKLIVIDDEAAYFVSICSNFNRVDHTLPEKAKALHRLMNGPLQMPIEAAAAIEGTSVASAKKLLTVLSLPQDVLDLMHPGKQKKKGQDVLGKMPSYEIARLASNPVLHEYARDLARRTVGRELKLPQVRKEVDRILSRSGIGRDVLTERNQPARRLKIVGGQIGIIIDRMREVQETLRELKSAGTLPEGVGPLESDFNNIADMAENVLHIIGAKRFRPDARK